MMKRAGRHSLGTGRRVRLHRHCRPRRGCVHSAFQTALRAALRTLLRKGLAWALDFNDMQLRLHAEQPRTKARRRMAKRRGMNVVLVRAEHAFYALLT